MRVLVVVYQMVVSIKQHQYTLYAFNNNNILLLWLRDFDIQINYKCN